MPQLDKLSFFSQFFYLIIFYFLFYGVFVFVQLPYFMQNQLGRYEMFGAYAQMWHIAGCTRFLRPFYKFKHISRLVTKLASGIDYLIGQMCKLVHIQGLRVYGSVFQSCSFIFFNFFFGMRFPFTFSMAVRRVVRYQRYMYISYKSPKFRRFLYRLSKKFRNWTIFCWPQLSQKVFPQISKSLYKRLLQKCYV